jgi:hypothetical protein
MWCGHLGERLPGEQRRSIFRRGCVETFARKICHLGGQNGRMLTGATAAQNLRGQEQVALRMRSWSRYICLWLPPRDSFLGEFPTHASVARRPGGITLGWLEGDLRADVNALSVDVQRGWSMSSSVLWPH